MVKRQISQDNRNAFLGNNVTYMQIGKCSHVINEPCLTKTSLWVFLTRADTKRPARLVFKNSFCFIVKNDNELFICRWRKTKALISLGSGICPCFGICKIKEVFS